ncbi:MAG: polyprenyl synthetase family protein [Deltaproteobacteria bacterium]|nr:polyprenyl synthetase family protein [Deltaproteobacteria bacterium]
MDLDRYFAERRRVVDEALARYLPGEDEGPGNIHRAMRYSVFAGGKRLRPILTLAAAEAVGARGETVLPAACAIELIHTYSLIHDDLPAMDDANVRRGTPTNHRVFGEATAILAGDALLTMAFQLIADPRLMPHLGPALRLRVVHEVALAAGSMGMVGGQVLDLDAEKMVVGLEDLEQIHRLKTSRLLEVSVRAGALAGEGSPSQIQSLGAYGERIGLAFQIADDILDVIGDTHVTGKESGIDEARGRATYPALLGLEPSRRRAEQLAEEAIACLAAFDQQADPLREIARYIVGRQA